MRSRAAAALERKKELFSSYARNRQEEQTRMQGWLNELKAEAPASLNDRLNAIDNAWPGALPTAEFDRAAGMRIPFGLGWQSREQARRWALKTLDGRPVLAVDGSQIVPTTDYSYPVGAVQIGWFFNDRRTAVDSDEGMVDSDGTGHYEKDIAFEVLAPDELFDAAGGDDGVFPGWRVNQERFILECAKLCEFMESCAQRPFARRPVCFFDGSLIISFAGQLRAGREHGYIQAVQGAAGLLRAHADASGRLCGQHLQPRHCHSAGNAARSAGAGAHQRRFPIGGNPARLGGSQPVLGMRTPGSPQQ